MLDVRFLCTTFSIDINPFYVVFLLHFFESYAKKFIGKGGKHANL
jgi:hypothetical protein